MLVATLVLVTGCDYLTVRRTGGRIAPERTTLRVGVGNPIDTAPLRIAVADGTFTRAGLRVELIEEPGSADGPAALTSGTVDVAFATDVDFCKAAAAGTPLRIEAEADTAAPDTMALMTLPDSGYTDLTGKKAPRIAVDERDGLGVLTVRSMFATAGGDPGKIKFVQYPFERMSAALSDRSADAALMIESFITQAQQNSAPGYWPTPRVARRPTSR